MLQAAIFSVASAFADDREAGDAEEHQAFTDEVRKPLKAECDRPTLSAVIALSNLTNYHTSRRSPTLGCMYFGM